jgi:hypothetical protein
VLDLDPPNSEFGLRLKDFGWKPSFVDSGDRVVERRLSSGCCLRSTRMVRAPLADGPRGGFQPTVCRVLRVFLRAFRLIHFAGGFLLHGVRGRSVLKCQTVRDGADGPRAYRGRSVIEGAVLEVQGLFSDSPSQPCGQSA